MLHFKIFKQQYMIVFFFQSMLVCFCFGLTNPVRTVCPDNIYTSSGSYQANMGSTFYSTNQVPNSLTYTITFVKPQQNNLYQAAVSLQKFHFMIDTDFRINYFLSIGQKTVSTIQILMTSPRNKYIPTMAFRYLIIASYLKSIYVQYVLINVNQIIPMSPPYIVKVVNVSSVMNMNDSSDPYFFITGLDIVGKNAYSLSFLITSAHRLSSTSIQINVVAQSTYYCSSYSIFFIDYNIIQARNGSIKYGLMNLYYVIYSSTGSVNFTTSTSDSYIYGIISLSVVNQNYIRFSFTNSISEIIVTTSNSHISIYILLMRIFTADYCCQQTLYYQSTTNLCYDICPNNYYADLNQMRCEKLTITGPPIGLIIGIVCGFVFFVISVGVGVYCYRKRKIQKYADSKPQSSSNQNLNNSNAKQQNQFIQKSLWIQNKLQFNKNQQCQICLFPRCSMKLPCGHLFHVNCFIKQKKQSCPNCNQKIQQNKIVVICQKCKSKSKSINLINLTNDFCPCQ